MQLLNESVEVLRKYLEGMEGLSYADTYWQGRWEGERVGTMLTSVVIKEIPKFIKNNSQYVIKFFIYFRGGHRIYAVIIK